MFFLRRTFTKPSGDKIRFLDIRNYFEYERSIAQDCLAPIFRNHEVTIQGARLLEIGCGFGGTMYEFREFGAETMGIDIDSDTLQAGATLKEFNSLPLVQASCDLLPFQDDRFEIVVMHEVLEHLKNPAPSLLEVSRVMKKKGHLLLTFPPYYSAFGGHVKIKGLFYLPWNHLWLPRSWVYKLSTRKGWSLVGLRKQRALMESENHMTIKRFHDILAGLPLEILFEKRYLIRPIFRKRYGIPTLGAGIFGRIPYLREILVTGCELLLRKV